MSKASKITLVLGLALASSAGAFSLDLPAKVVGEEARRESPGSYALPIAAFDGSKVPSLLVEGLLDQRAFQLDASGTTTLAVLAPLRDQVLAAGYDVIFECEAQRCGGFDFRFGTDVMPEPEMHVDLGDFRFISAKKAGDVVSILVSRSAGSAYVQITRVTDTPQPLIPVKTAINLDEDQRSRNVTADTQQATGIEAALDSAGVAVLNDLVFASGAATLTEGDYPSLAAVAAWLEANSDGTIALVGHTDASGSLTANVALSERRAKAVAAVLIESYGVDPTRIAAEGVGFLAPRATNQTEDGRQRNRRVEVIVTSTR